MSLAARNAGGQADTDGMLHPMAARSDDRRLARGRAFPLRRLSARLRGLPDFLIVGAMKCGTSSLFEYLCRHPRIARPVRKEAHFFTHGWHHGRGVGWYRAHFPLAARRPGILTGEATPGYMFEEEAPRRIASVVPEAKLIVLLRDPVERAISHYRHEVRMGRETLPIETAVAVEEDRRARARAAGAAGRETFLHASYKARGQYAEQIERLLHVFPRDRLLILDSGRLSRDPAGATAEAFRFLGLEDHDLGDALPRRNASPESGEVPAAVREMLARHFAPHDARLRDLLGADLAW